MKRKMAMSLILAAILAIFTLSIGCDDDDGGSTSHDNVKACNDWLASMSCGSFDFSTGTDCNIYKDATTCDLSPYFKCLTNNTTCDEVNGIPDITGWTNCQDQNTCN